MATKVRKTAAAPIGTGHQNPLIPHARLQQLYMAMLECRMLAERLSVHTRSRSAAKLSGLEAVYAGTVLGLLPQDSLSSTPGDMLTPLLKGQTLSELFCKSPRKGKPVSSAAKFLPSSLNVVPSAPDVTAQVNIASGVALACKQTRNGAIVLVFLGERSMPDNMLQQGLQYAAANNLPILYVQQCGPLADRVSAQAKSKAAGSSSRKTVAGILPSITAHGVPFPSIAVDSSDVVAVYRVTQECIARARSGGGPALIECYTLPPVAPQLGHRKSTRTAIDPVVAMEQYLTTKGLFTAAWKKHLASSFARQLNAAARSAR